MDDRLRALLREDLEELEAYVPVKPLDVLAAEIGLPIGQLVKLDANENLYGPIPEIREAVERADLHIYPDPGQTELRRAIAGYAGVTPEQVVAGQGADDLIDIILRLARPEFIVDCPPTFGMYRFLGKINGAIVIDVPRRPAFEVDFAGIEVAVEMMGATVIFLTSPNNPTGNLLPPEQLAELLKLNALIVVDEAYVEFSGGTLTGFLAEAPNLILLRTFSKWAALAGLRVGYALCHPDLAAAMMAIKQPYNVSVTADVAARTAIEHKARIFESVRALIAERDRMAARVASLGWLKPYPSAANFVLFQVEGRPASDIAAALRKRGVLIRYYARPDLENVIRISAGRPEDTDRLVAALKEIA